MIRDNEIGLAPSADDLGQLPRHASTRDRGVRDRRQALLRHVIDDVQDAEAPPRAELVVDKVDRPTRVRLRLDEERRPCSGGALPATPPPDRQSFLPIEPLRLLAVHDVPLVAQEHMQPPVAKAPLLSGKLAQPRAQLGISRSP